MHELRGLGSEYAATRQACKRYALHHCGHEDPVSAAECLTSQIQGGNHEHFFIASQDRKLQRKVMDMPGGAVLFSSVNGVTLEDPSDVQKKHALNKGEALQRPSTVGLKRKPEEGSEEDGEERQRARDTVAFRRQKAKGPNPLSIRKKKKDVQGSKAGAAVQGGEQPEQPKTKRQRRRRGGEEGSGGE